MVLDRKSSHEYPVNAGVSQGSIPGLTLFLLLVTFLMMLSMLMILLSTLSVIRLLICGLELASELKSDLQDIDWDRKWLVDFNAGKTQLVSFDWSITVVLLMRI